MSSLLDLCKDDFTYDASITNKEYAIKWLEENFTMLRRQWERNAGMPGMPITFLEWARFAYKTWYYVERKKEQEK